MDGLDLDLDLEAEAVRERYWDLLVLYLLTGSALGPCDLARRLGSALDDGSDQAVTAALAHFDSQPADLKAIIRDGDPTLDTLLQSAGGAAMAPQRRSRPASA